MNLLGKKSTWLFVCLFWCGAFTINAQSLKNVFSNSESPLVYLGIDFSKSRLIDLGNPTDIRDRLYNSINQVIIMEPKKYDLKGAFLKSNVENNLDAVTKNNATANLNDILSTNSSDFNRFKESDVTAVVKELNIEKKDAVGVVFVMEAMRKLDKKGDAAIWVTFIDMKNKKMLMTERIEVKSDGGFGFRNYWASCIKNLLETIEKRKYKEWKAKYSS
jgi:3-methyladenine DNA glycosylase AlkC